MEELLSIKQVAGIFGMSILHVRNLLKKGIIPYTNCGIGEKRERPRIKKEDVEKFLKEKTK